MAKLVAQAALKGGALIDGVASGKAIRGLRGSTPAEFSNVTRLSTLKTLYSFLQGWLGLELDWCADGAARQGLRKRLGLSELKESGDARLSLLALDNGLFSQRHSLHLLEGGGARKADALGQLGVEAPDESGGGLPGHSGLQYLRSFARYKCCVALHLLLQVEQAQKVGTN